MTRESGNDESRATPSECAVADESVPENENTVQPLLSPETTPSGITLPGTRDRFEIVLQPFAWPRNDPVIRAEAA